MRIEQMLFCIEQLTEQHLFDIEQSTEQHLFDLSCNRTTFVLYLFDNRTNVCSIIERNGGIMTIEEKKQAILQAVASGKVTGTQLEPSRRGTSISFLKKGKHLADITINNLYENLIKLCPDLCHTEQTTEQKLFDTEQLAEQKLFDTEQLKQKKQRMEEVEKENLLLRKKLEKLQKKQEEREMEESRKQELTQISLQAIAERLDVIEKRLCTLEQSPEKPKGQTEQPSQIEPSKEIMGFRLTQKVTRTHGKAYQKWYAVKGSAIIYIGANPDKAEEKIKVWMENTQAVK